MTASERLDRVLEAAAPWRNGAVLVAFVGALVIGFQFPGTRATVAAAVTFALPPVLALFAWTRLRDASDALAAVGLALGLAASAASALAAHRGLFPPAPTDEARVAAGRDASIRAPDDGGAFVLEVSGRVEGRRRDTVQAPYALELLRGGATREVTGELSRQVRDDRSGRGAPSRSVSLHLTDRHELSLPGHGAATARLVSSEHLRGPLTLRVREPFALGALEIGVAAALLLLALAIEALATKAYAWTPLTALVAASLTLGAYTAMRHDPDQPLVAALAALAVAAGAGVAGLVLGVIGVLVSRRL